MSRGGINRAFSWIKRSLEVTEVTTVPERVLSDVTPTLDIFGWEKLEPLGGAVSENIAGALAADIALLTVVPNDVMRYVMFVSVMHDDPAGLTLSIQVRTPLPGGGSFDIAIGPATLTPLGPVKLGLERPFLLQPGQLILVRTTPAPAAGQRINNLTARFVDLPLGEYIAPL